MRLSKVAMRSPSSARITGSLHAWSAGEQQALNELMPLVERELRRVAHGYMSHQSPGITLQPTALVNEVYLRLLGASSIRWQDRAHFFAVCAQMMRRILVDAARARASVKRGGGTATIAHQEVIDAGLQDPAELLALDLALGELANLHPRKAKVVELRFFGGLGVEETAEVLQMSPQSVMRDWRLAKSWLAREVSRQQS